MLFAKICLYENFGSLLLVKKKIKRSYMSDEPFMSFI